MLFCCYLFVFNIRIDAAKNDGSLGRMANDEWIDPNAKMKKLVVDGIPRLALFALKSIMPGEEIVYDYGGKMYPWRSQVCSLCFKG